MEVRKGKLSSNSFPPSCSALPLLPAPLRLPQRNQTQIGSELREQLQTIFYLYKKGIFSKRHTKKSRLWPQRQGREAFYTPLGGEGRRRPRPGLRSEMWWDHREEQAPVGSAL